MSEVGSFESELVRAARSYIGQPAIYHQDFAGNCIERPAGACFEAGLGPGQFDCSGLIIRAHSDVMGMAVSDWPSDLRHAREMWAVATTDQPGLTSSEVVFGSILVLSREYHIGDRIQKIAGHVGIVTNVRSGLRYLHASPQAALVKEAPCRATQSTIMGAMKLDESWALVGTSLVE